MKLTRQLTIRNKRGLHARASAKFVKCVEQFDADVTVCRDDQTVPGNSILGLMMLAATTGTVISVSAEGADAERALAAIAEMVNGRFGEDLDQEPA